MADCQSGDNNTCVVCFKNVLYYSIGECDHPVCYECSTRMRVLCLTNECPICRHELSRVVFTDSIQLYKELRNKLFTEKLFERQFKIGFCSEEIKNAYDLLLENRCKLCEKIPPFRTFTALSDHMRKVHEKYYCDLCVKNLKIFSIERRFYTRQQLAHHRRKGDVDDTSHRGHPLCEFCEERFMDADELYRHLRKEHLYCHLCDADGRNQYYATHPALAHHFRTDHFLCEEGDCAGQHLTAVFRTEIDLKAHKASVHGRGLARSAARQARTLELQFNITPHPHTQRSSRVESINDSSETSTNTVMSSPQIDTGSVEQFPQLTATAPAPLLLNAPVRTYQGASSLTRNDKNFPALDGGGLSNVTTPLPQHSNMKQSVAASVFKNSKPSVSIQLHSQPTTASNFRLTQATGNRISIPAQSKKMPLNEEDFPALNKYSDEHPNIGAGTVQPSKVTLVNSKEINALKKTPAAPAPKKQQFTSEAFPALSSVCTPVAPPQWITVSKSKEKPKPQKLVTQEHQTSNNPIPDFPALSLKSKQKAKKGTNQQHNGQTENKLNDKKEKKKQTNLATETKSQSNITNGWNNNKRDYMDLSSNSTAHEIQSKIRTEDKANLKSKSKEQRLSGNGDFVIAANDYPPLSTSVVPPMPATILPNGTLSSVVKPRPPCDGMTFTNSAGETFPAPVHAYIPPPCFEQRNHALVKRFTEALGGNADLEGFKVASRAFRDNIIPAGEFYEHCKTVLGPQMDNVFPELVALLPDIAKQQELVIGRNISSQLNVCSVCGQLVACSDCIAHDTEHWPPLVTR